MKDPDAHLGAVEGIKKCPGSTVQPSREIRITAPVGDGFMVISGVAHAGLITHPCDLEAGHPGACRCACGLWWVKNF
jgi:hypothetical protein